MDDERDTASLRPGGREAAPRRGTGRPRSHSRVGRRPRRHRPWWLSTLVNVLVALLLVSVVQAFLVRVHTVASGSMQQSLGVNDRVLSSPLPYLAGDPERGDIIIFAHGETWDTPRRTPASNPLVAVVRAFGDLTGIGISNTNYTLKRIVGMPGETVSCCDAQGRVIVDGRPLDEPYVYRDLPFEPGVSACTAPGPSPRCFAPVTVPRGRYLVLGDHRSNSADSVLGCRGEAADAACARFVTREQISGQVIFRLWPPGPVG